MTRQLFRKRQERLILRTTFEVDMIEGISAGLIKQALAQLPDDALLLTWEEDKAVDAVDCLLTLHFRQDQEREVEVV